MTTLTAGQAAASIAVMALVTFLTRALPFLLFDRREKPPELVIYLGQVLPPGGRGVPHLAQTCCPGIGSSWGWSFSTSSSGGFLLPLKALPVILAILPEKSGFFAFKSFTTFFASSSVSEPGSPVIIRFPVYAARLI